MDHWRADEISPLAEGSVLGPRNQGDDNPLDSFREETDRNPAQEVRRQKDLYETLLQAQSDLGQGLLILEDGRLLNCNEAFCEISGYSVTALSALPTIFDLAVPHERFALEEKFGRLGIDYSIEGRYETAIRHASGRRVELEVTAKLLRGQAQRSYLVAVVRDITGRRQVEEKLTSATSELLALHEASRILTSTLELEKIGERLLEVMHRISGLDAAVLHILTEEQRLRALSVFGSESLRNAASSSSRAQAARRVALETKERQLFHVERSEARSCPLVGLSLPLRVQDQVIGVLDGFAVNGTIGETTIGTLECLVSQAASALENARLFREVAEREDRFRDLVGKLLVAQEQERRRIAHEVHDGLTQVAIGTHQSLQAFANDHPPANAASSEMLGRALELARQTVREARQVIADLRPPTLDDFGLAAALRVKVQTLQAAGWEIGYDETLGVERLPADIDTGLYRVAQEALTNIRKHAHTSSVYITLTCRDHRICLQVKDKGCGFDQHEVLGRRAGPGEHIGLSSMQERVVLLGGECRIYSQPGAGTAVVAEVPLPRFGRQVTSMRDKDSPVRLLLADDHALAREGVKTMLASEPYLVVVGEAKDGREALDLCWRLEPDLVLMDVRMPEMNGLEATREIKVGRPDTIVLVLTTYEDVDYLFEAVRAGAAGYVLKDATKQELVDAIRRTLRGKNSLDQELAMRLLQQLCTEAEQRESEWTRRTMRPEPLPEPLTPRELEIVRLLAQGLTNRQISQELTVSAATVKVHIEHVLAKLKVSDRTQAAVLASQAGLLDPPP